MLGWSNARPRQRSQRAPTDFIDPCLPTKVTAAPAGEAWVHVIKHDGYLIQIHIGTAGVRVFLMRGTTIRWIAGGNARLNIPALSFTAWNASHARELEAQVRAGT